MSPVVHHHTCPVCNSTAIHPLQTVKDFAVSGETFAIWQCEVCQLRFTQDAPDESVIGRYYKSEDYISHTNTGNGFINQLYLNIRKFTLQLKSNVIKKYTGLANGHLLDVGAGTGAFIHYMQQNSWTVTGVEPDAGARTVAQDTFGITLQPNAVLKNLPEQSFDAITLWHVLEHVQHLHDYMDFLKRLLKPGGKLFIAVPNYQSVDAGIYRLAWAAYDVPRHLYHFAPASIQALVQRHGLKIEAHKPMWFDAFYISLLSSKYKNGKTNWIGAAGTGFRSNITALLNKSRCSSLIYVIAA
jgi:2-polyprenyl-3-methyl-5-hydroxy-6-metoxy-1,4-benzoquinol methylase